MLSLITTTKSFQIGFTMSQWRRLFSEVGSMKGLCESLKSKRAARVSFTAWCPGASLRAPVGSRGRSPAKPTEALQHFQCKILPKLVLFQYIFFFLIFTYRKRVTWAIPPHIKKWWPRGWSPLKLQGSASPLESLAI